MKGFVPAPPISDLTLLPVVLMIAEISRIYRLSPATIYKQIRAGVFVPPPWARSPYRWRREDILADLRRDRLATPHRRKPMKASLNVASAIQREAQ
jgi:hypothetical protein